MAARIRDLARYEVHVRVVRVIVPVGHLGTEGGFCRVEVVEDVDILREAVAVVADVVHEELVPGDAGLQPGHVVLADDRAGAVRDPARDERHVRGCRVIVRIGPVPVEGADRGVEIVVDLDPFVEDGALSLDPMKEILFNHGENLPFNFNALKSITRVLVNALLR